MNEEEKRTIEKFIEKCSKYDESVEIKGVSVGEEYRILTTVCKALNLIEKLQKENEKLKRENKNIKEANYYWSSRYCNICNNSISKQKAKDKIEKYKNICISNVKGYENYFKNNYDELVFKRMEQLEKELLGDE